MKIADGERAERGIERAKRWVRVNVLKTQSHDLFYPICDVATGPAEDARLVFDGARSLPSAVHLNGRPIELIDVEREGSRASARVSNPSSVWPGENVLSVPVTCGVRRVTLEGSSPATGRLGWRTANGRVQSGIDPTLAASASFLLSSLGGDPLGTATVSATVWDPARRCVRLWSWYWTTAIVYEALVALREHAMVTFDPEPLEQGFLDRQIMNGEAKGSYMVRWDPDRESPTGVVPWHATNDSAYIGLHGLLVAHRRTGDAPWIARAESLARWIMDEGVVDGRLRVGWNAASGRWDDSWLYVDAAWTPGFLVALARVTGADELIDAADGLASDVVARLGTDGPYLTKIWRANGHHTSTVFGRGMAWVLEGWLPLLEAGRDNVRARTKALIEALLRDQNDDGSWNYLLDQSTTGPCNKGTPALALHLQRARRVFPDLDAHLDDAVARALAWSERHMLNDPDDPGHGGIFSHNAEGAISTVRDIATAFNYGSAYYVLTRLERMP